jgi:hypothetical protein
MSLESFFGLDNSDTQGSKEASEKYREQAAANAAAIKAMTANQAAQKGKEDRLAQILIKYLTDASQADLVFLIVKLLQENVPGAFILAILAIGDPELERELHKEFKESGLQNSDSKNLVKLETLPSAHELPQNLHADLNAWGSCILQAGQMAPGRTLQTVLTPEQKLKSIVLDLVEYTLEHYLSRHGFSFSETNLRSFALLSVQSVLIKLRELSQEKSDIEILETNPAA